MKHVISHLEINDQISMCNAKADYLAKMATHTKSSKKLYKSLHLQLSEAIFIHYENICHKNY